MALLEIGRQWENYHLLIINHFMHASLTTKEKLINITKVKENKCGNDSKRNFLICNKQPIIIK